MTSYWMFGFAAIAVSSVCMLSDVAALCDTDSPITETAYVGAYEIQFPETKFSISDPSSCRWLISAYRKDYVVQLEFDDVLLEKNSQIDVCVEEISIYDGPKTTDTIIASFCGMEKPKIMTSSRDTLIVFSSNKSSLEDGTFKLKYKAVKDRQQSGDTGQILRIAFGAAVGTIACIVVFRWAFRKYKQALPNRGVFIFGCPRINTSGHENIRVTPRNRGTGVTGNQEVSQTRRPERMSFKNKVTGFLQDVVMKLSPRRVVVDSLATMSRDNINHPHQQVHQSLQNDHANYCHGRPVNLNNTSTYSNNDGSEVCTVNISQNPFHCTITNIDNIRDGQMTFGYPIIPLNGFTSDPDAVRPPTYEDCVNSVNSLYLHYHRGNTFYNRAFNLKDEESDCVQIFSPPPPYSEIGEEIPSLRGTSGGVRQSAWTDSYQQPPQYAITSADDTVITMPHTDIAGQDTVIPEQSCERGETVINASAMPERSFLTRSACAINSTASATEPHTCDLLISAATVQSEAVFELANKSMSNNSREVNLPTPERDSTGVAAAATRLTPSNAQSAVSAHMNLLRRTGFIPLHCPDNTVLWNEEPQREISASETSKMDLSYQKPPTPDLHNSQTGNPHEFSNSVRSEINSSELTHWYGSSTENMPVASNIVLSDLEEETQIGPSTPNTTTNSDCA